MNVVDSSGWLEHFGNGSNAPVFASIIKNSPALIAPTVSKFEVFKRVSIQRDEEEALKAIAIMSPGKVVDLTIEIALSAAEISLDYKIPMADSMILATARAHDTILWTQDQDFMCMEGVKYIEK